MDSKYLLIQLPKAWYVVGVERITSDFDYRKQFH